MGVVDSQSMLADVTRLVTKAEMMLEVMTAVFVQLLTSACIRLELRSTGQVQFLTPLLGKS